MSPPDDHRALRITLGVLLPALLVIAALLPLLIFQSRLPEPMATHWGMRGRPNGAMAHATLAMLLVGITCAMAIVMSFFAHRRGAGRGEISHAMAVTAFVGAQMAVVGWMIVLANLDAPDWRRAEQLGLGKALASLLIPVAMAATVARLSRALETVIPVDIGKLPRAGLAPGARAVWMGGARAAWAAPAAIGCIALSFIISRARPELALAPCIVALAFLFFTNLRVKVDHAGVRIAFGMFGWPVQRVPLSDIRQAAALKVEPMAWGGWGYRGSLRMMKRAAIVLRGGEGIRLDLTGDRTLVITVDGAEQAAGLINDLVAAKR